MTIDRALWVVVDHDVDPAALLGAAAAVAAEVDALVIGERSLADRTAALGPRTTSWLGHPPSPDTGDLAAVVAGLVDRAGAAAPAAVLLAASPAGRLLSGRLAARLGTAAVTDAVDVADDGAALVVTHPLYAGAALRTERILSPCGVVTLGPAALAGPRPAEGSPATAEGPPTTAEGPPATAEGSPATAAEGSPATVVALEPPEPSAAFTVVDRQPEERTEHGLASARVVVGAGRGVATRDGLERVRALADALGGELACTRPLAEGLGWMGRDRYVGVSGLDLAPDLYVAVGISGQMQHMVGVRRAKVIVAVNDDPAAPVFAQADYGIVGDLNQVVPALTALLEGQP
ncbi:MAG TPA: electron transfer flavoprotein subunit alpha/FixB family protein [Acidimicrobiales bacterium]|nr:electron transfer flavoprotein subunit alpha/FixB family protein [Acidimicrobiales bacterium]